MKPFNNNCSVAVAVVIVLNVIIISLVSSSPTSKDTNANNNDSQGKSSWSKARRDYYKRNPIPLRVTYRGRSASDELSRLEYQVPFNDANDINSQQIPDLRDLPSLLLQNQKSRATHQQETFGSKISEPIRDYIANDYIFCDSLNNLTNESDQSFPHVSKTGFKQYPSHVGLYKKSNNENYSPSDYICGASWINDQYLLTAASCVQNKRAEDIVAQFNEWNHLHNNAAGSLKFATSLIGNKQSKLTSTTFKRAIEFITIFPEYSKGSREHDLALLELKPLTEFNEAISAIMPSCQFNDRRSLHAKSCWLPHRNVTIIEKADLEELTFTHEKKTTLTGKAVRLFVSDQTCQEHTGLPSFTSLVPNMLCSVDSYMMQSEKDDDTGLPVDNGSGIYCYEGGFRSLVSIVTPSSNAHANTPKSNGFLDINYYKPWIFDITNRHTA